MVQDNQKIYKVIYVLIDAVILVVSYVFSWMLRFQTMMFGESVRALPLDYYFRVLIPIFILYLILYQGFNLYTMQSIQGRRAELSQLLKANIVGLLLIILGLYMARQQHFARSMLFIFFVLNVVLDTVARNIIRDINRRRYRKGINVKQVLLVGYSPAAEAYIDRIIENPEWGYVVRGILDDHVPRGTEYRGIMVMGQIENLDYILPLSHLDEIAITLGLNEYYRLQEIVAMCEKSGVHTLFIPDYHNIIPTKPYTEDLLGLPVVNIRYVPLSNTFNAVLKRLGDIIGSLICIVLFSPIMLFAVVGIKITSPGPLIFRQTRVGLHNTDFEMLKFRSMDVQKPEDEAKAWTVKNDPRVTRFGKLIRKTSIDELPQLFNVLKGDMSLVGPRPERPLFVEKFREEIPRYMVKHQVRPGMTGWAQVNGYRGDTSIPRRIDCDIYYIENWSVSLDIKILILTVFKGFINKNAY